MSNFYRMSVLGTDKVWLFKIPVRRRWTSPPGISWLSDSVFFPQQHHPHWRLFVVQSANFQVNYVLWLLVRQTDLVPILKYIRGSVHNQTQTESESTILFQFFSGEILSYFIEDLMFCVSFHSPTVQLQPCTVRALLQQAEPTQLKMRAP